MNERDKTPFGPDPRRFVYQPHPFLFQLSERRFDVINLDRYVVYTAAAFLQKLADRRIVGCWFKELDTALAQRKHRHADLLIGHFFGMNVL